MAYLLERLSDAETVLTPVGGDRLRIGRGTNAELRFDDAAVDFEHAAIERRGEAWLLTDRNSVTGTYLNGQRVGSAPLVAGDTIGIGRARIRVEGTAADGALRLRIEDEAAPAAADVTASGTLAVAVLQAPAVDFLARYRLRRPLLTKASLVLLLTALAVGAVLAIPRLGWLRLFQPGPLQPKHLRQAGIGPQGCFTCHTPWRGPTATSCAAAGCHPASAHQAGRVVDPPCGSCHAEHGTVRWLEPAAEQAACVPCHRDLRALGTPRFAARATQFGVDHPEFALALAGGRRLPLSHPAARRGDPTRLAFGHRRHLRPGLQGRAEGPVQLRCASCHEPGGGRTGIAPVNFARHCQACHALTFDNRLARRRNQVPHADAEAVTAFLYRAYGEVPDTARTLAERRRRLTRRGGALTVPGVPLEVVQAQGLLARRICAECHAVDLDAPVQPATVPTAMPAGWLPHAEFRHASHVKPLECTSCHAQAARSDDTADVLLPGIAACGGCHGGGEPPPGVAPTVARETCASCHRYHTPGVRRAAR